MVAEYMPDVGGTDHEIAGHSLTQDFDPAISCV